MGRVSRAVLEIRALEPEHASRVLEEPRFRTLPAFEAYLGRCEDVLAERPRDGHVLAKAAPSFACLLGSGNASALAILASSYRANGDLETADITFGEALHCARTAEERAFVRNRLTILRVEQGQLAEALELASQAMTAFRDARNLKELAAAMMARSIVHFFRGDWSGCAADCRAAMLYINPRQQRRLHQASIHNLGVALLFGALTPQDLREVFATLKKARQLLRRYGIRRRSVPDAKLRWVEALALTRIGATGGKTERLLTGARADLLELGAMIEVARVSLDLGELYRGQGRWAELRRISADTVHLDRSQYSLETLSALLLWRQACLEETLDERTAAHMYKVLYGVERRR